MGTSNRHKKQKQTDFTKRKLRVGKTARQKDNFTDTSFKAKSISLNQKKILSPSLNEEGALKKKLSILRKSTQNLNSRKEILAELLNALIKHYDSVSSHMDEILKISNILILDRSRKIREMNLELWKYLVDNGKISILILHLDTLLLFINSGMTHLSNGVRLDSLKYLDCLLSNTELSDLIVKSDWFKLLKNFMILMNWTTDNNNGKNLVVREGSSQLLEKDLARDRINELKVLEKLLLAGCTDHTQYNENGNGNPHQLSYNNIQIHAYTKYYMLPDKPNPYGGLKLFTEIKKIGSMESGDFQSVSTDDMVNRIKVLCEAFGDGLQKGLTELSKEENRELANKASNLITEYDRIRKEYISAA
ncbi:hypothetical protein FOA43_002367 [Brettanomyces nanus]|uniref:Pre-rRNA-processing protein n=1 Tax=Eeniella nana TaxID=13502 RepID=A0A875RUX2_EENNA|nr:uncharacterized protein FOA43_002367 [Brettanomyces nanus]QPG75027.1 hypothetical protein FOA43_002367 [Brettanomyces nanus]